MAVCRIRVAVLPSLSQCCNNTKSISPNFCEKTCISWSLYCVW